MKCAGLKSAKNEWICPDCALICPPSKLIKNPPSKHNTVVTGILNIERRLVAQIFVKIYLAEQTTMN